MSDENVKNNLELDLDDLDKAAGGAIFDADGRYEVIDDNNGDVLESIPYEKGYRADRMIAQDAARRAAYKRGLSRFELSWNQLNNLRNGNN